MSLQGSLWSLWWLFILIFCKLEQFVLHIWKLKGQAAQCGLSLRSRTMNIIVLHIHVCIVLRVFTRVFVSVRKDANIMSCRASTRCLDCLFRIVWLKHLVKWRFRPFNTAWNREVERWTSYYCAFEVCIVLEVFTGSALLSVRNDANIKSSRAFTRRLDCSFLHFWLKQVLLHTLKLLFGLATCISRSEHLV